LEVPSRLVLGDNFRFADHPDVGLLGAYVVADLAARIKMTRKTIESGIPEHRLVELSFWTQESRIDIMGD